MPAASDFGLRALGCMVAPCKVVWISEESEANVGEGGDIPFKASCAMAAPSENISDVTLVIKLLSKITVAETEVLAQGLSTQESWKYLHPGVTTKTPTPFDFRIFARWAVVRMFAVFDWAYASHGLYSSPFC